MAMSADGTTLVIGAPDTRINSTNGVGRIHIYEREAGEWVHVQAIDCPPTLTLPDGSVLTASFAQFGSSVDIDADASVIVVGAWGFAGPADPIFSGRAFVYAKDDTAEVPWGEYDADLGYSRPTAELRPETLESIDLFGQSVAIDVVAGEGRVVVGRPLAGSSNTGALHVFEGADATWDEVAVLTAADVGGPSDQLGTQVDIDGDVIVAGVQNADTAGGSNAGEAYTYLRTKAGWSTTPSQVIRAGDGEASDAFGGSVCIFGDALAIGASGHDNDSTGAGVAGCGTVYLYRRVGNAFNAEDQVWARESAQNDAFGIDLSFASDGALLVGASGYEGAEINSGVGFYFTREAGGAWELSRADLWPVESGLSEGLGRQVAVAITRGAPIAVLASEYPAVSGEPAIAFGLTYSEAATPAAGGPPLQDGAPATPDAPGADGAEFEGEPTGGTPSGGGVPSGGVGGGSVPNVTIPLTPILEDWGLVRGTMILKSDNKILGIQSDGINFRHDAPAEFIANIPEDWTFIGSPDMNGDQSGDLLFIDEANDRIKVMVRDGFTISETVNGEDIDPDASVVALGDFNGDGTDDLVFREGLALTCTFVSSFGYDGTASALLPVLAADPGAESWQFFAADAPVSTTDDDDDDSDDNDGTDAGFELIAHNRIAGATYWIDFGDEDGNDAVRALPTGQGAFRGVGDFDSDGTADLVWQDGTHLVFHFLRDGGALRQARKWAFDMNGYRIGAISDIDGNGTPDLFLQGHGGIVVFRLGFTSIPDDPESGASRVKLDVLGRRWYDHGDAGTLTGFAER